MFTKINKVNIISLYADFGGGRKIYRIFKASVEIVSIVHVK